MQFHDSVWPIGPTQSGWRKRWYWPSDSWQRWWHRFRRSWTCTRSSLLDPFSTSLCRRWVVTFSCCFFTSGPSPLNVPVYMLEILWTGLFCMSGCVCRCMHMCVCQCICMTCQFGKSWCVCQCVHMCVMRDVSACVWCQCVQVCGCSVAVHVCVVRQFVWCLDVCSMSGLCMCVGVCVCVCVNIHVCQCVYLCMCL